MATTITYMVNIYLKLLNWRVLEMSNFSAISWREQATFDEMMDDNVCFILGQYA
jgi:hypothetical protein